ncbi:MAG: DEAD/DEAH box helicase family protein, partial [Thiomargarita sp.]|nr:DEAD/DEAH box helicase family protein [Thiomargarita sp.]
MIENPVINAPFDEPKRHFKFTETGITNKIIKGRRESTYFIPIPQSKSKIQNNLDFQVQNKATPNQLINEIRKQVSVWRLKDYPYATKMTQRLLAHWKNPERERKLFFCQIEALETIIYLTEIASHRDGQKGRFLLEKLALLNQEATPETRPVLHRLACKMATGSGKTVVMSMLITWQVLNKIAHPKSTHFTDQFIVVVPGVTIRDRLRVLQPNDPENYYQKLDLVPSSHLSDLGRAKIIISNYHAFMLRDTVDAAKLSKNILGQKKNPSLFTESPGQMIQRVCGGLSKHVIVLNDEAHHCYHRKPIAEKGKKLIGDARKEAERNEQEARTWITGLEAIKNTLGLKAVYDLSATPFFLSGSGYGEGTLFPWVVSDFSL